MIGGRLLSPTRRDGPASAGGRAEREGARVTGAAESVFSSFPVLTTRRLVLRELVPEDAADLFRFRSDAEEQRYNAVPLRTVSEALALIDDLRAAYAARRQLQWGLTLREAPRVIGLLGFIAWERGHRRAEIGYDLARPLWGRGLGTEAVGALVRFGFERLGLNRIEAQTIVDNLASVRLLERLGFRREGVRREYSLEEDGRFHGGAIYGLLRREYLAGVAGGPVSTRSCGAPSRRPRTSVDGTGHDRRRGTG
jgi:ribosomal-protein-alanine N-acetyltransferase